jgi:hypothetical protein
VCVYAPSPGVCSQLTKSATTALWLLLLLQTPQIQAWQCNRTFEDCEFDLYKGSRNWEATWCNWTASPDDSWTLAREERRSWSRHYATMNSTKDNGTLSSGLECATWSEKCLLFQYQLGAASHALRVVVQNAGTGKRVSFKTLTSVKSYWTSVCVPISARYDFVVQFEGFRRREGPPSSVPYEAVKVNHVYWFKPGPVTIYFASCSEVFRQGDYPLGCTAEYDPDFETITTTTTSSFSSSAASGDFLGTNFNVASTHSSNSQIPTVLAILVITMFS